MDNNMEKKNSFLPSGWTRADTIANIFGFVVSIFVEWLWYTPTKSPVLQILGLFFVWIFASWVIKGIILKFSKTESK